MMHGTYVMHKMTLPDSWTEDVTDVVSLLASYLTSQMLPNGYPMKTITICARTEGCGAGGADPQQLLLGSCHLACPLAQKELRETKIQFSFVWVLHFFVDYRQNSKNLATLASFCSQLNNEILEDF